MIEYFSLIHRFIPPGSVVYNYYIPHVVQVTAKALAVAEKLKLDVQQKRFIEEAAMLHDIGIVRVQATDIGCEGELAYIAHGVEGARILLAEGLTAHARVCERHTGVGITAEDIRRQALPLPEQDLLPETLEEQIICYADKWYSKDPHKLWRPYQYPEILESFEKFDRSTQMKQVFTQWHQSFQV